MPLDALKEKAKAYVESGLINEELAERVVRVIESERGDATYINDVRPGDQPDAAVASSTLTTRLSPEQLKELLDKRVEMMKQGGTDDGVTDQYRVYSHIIERLQGDQPLRLLVQASVGTGKSSCSPTSSFGAFCTRRIRKLPRRQGAVSRIMQHIPLAVNYYCNYFRHQDCCFQYRD